MVGVADRRGTNAEGLLGIFYVLDYGATGDGQHDDAGGIQAAISAASSVGGGLVAVPPGVYRLGSNVVWGAAANVTIWQHSGVSFTGPGSLPAPAGSNTIRVEPSGTAIGGVPTTSVEGDAAAAGATGVAADAGHRHGREAFGGAAVVQAFSDAAGAGVAATPSRSDHRHGMPGDQSVTSRLVNLTKATADVVTSETTTSATYVDLTTPGPSVTLTPGVAQSHEIMVSMYATTNTAAANALAAPSIAGAAAADVDAAQMDSAVANAGGVSTRVVLAAAVASGATHTMKYRVAGGATATFVRRRIVAKAV